MSGQLIHKRKNLWLLRIQIDIERSSGKPIFKTVKFEGHRGAARAELDRLIRALPTHSNVEPSHITVNAHLDLWFEVIAQNHYRFNTLQNYILIVALDVRARIGNMKIADVRPRDIRQILKEMALRGVSSNTRRRLYYVISRAFEFAVSWGTLLINPVSGVEPPRGEPREMYALSEDEVKVLLDVTDKGRHAEYFRTAIATGMRPAELGGLRWHDIDFETNSISVQRALVWKGAPAEGWLLAPPKTNRGRRQVAIPKSLAISLLELRKRQEQTILRAGCGYQNSNFVFANSWGRPFRRQFITSVFKVALKRAGLSETIRLYDLRHTSATLLLKAGEHIKVVSERLGHAGIWITLNTYIHVLPGMDRDASIRIETLLNIRPQHPETN
jgi:integrase